MQSNCTFRLQEVWNLLGSWGFNASLNLTSWRLAFCGQLGMQRPVPGVRQAKSVQAVGQPITCYPLQPQVGWNSEQGGSTVGTENWFYQFSNLWCSLHASLPLCSCGVDFEFRTFMLWDSIFNRVLPPKSVYMVIMSLHPWTCKWVMKGAAWLDWTI